VTDFLDRLASQLRANKSAACRRAIQRILALMKKDYEAGRYTTHTEAENEFRRLVEYDEACNPPPLDWTTRSPEAKTNPGPGSTKRDSKTNEENICLSIRFLSLSKIFDSGRW
jgi:hypothetical protein